ncbi:MAG: AAA family ATPase [Paracoccus sp. (in: a-proteobacteria)]|jgi:MoxR-like ATPase|uniref:AAA family ATPase n=1 Tax=unclassified Paracoccus (in: a-proteobacteria) TaxID=2688777 RepID=UPI000C375C52|nr:MULTISPECIES: MoxR family ATPase [unclassified Paracoccus (in: a-proteobacteria)]MAN57757.1 AAA family ATPase [Paracoccus sp. (in: a-proteobacteria)]MBA48492.1 AAA family ATPase [Paracoccus sp. (in: a-proteobacteria)]MCS5602799.1 MoxR family ATPase [Paracoccus sp. (in: a-proteobacteria)]MDB2551835.1 MoxR family ATPase [Paracoccus sp. (in: a-proteobacteria)]|tara:strand:- start:84 stop:1091 length:1008 start_codon:yes stop_codon:yes gene_type:complete
MASDEILVQEVQTLGARLADARASIEGRFVGQHHVVEQVLAAILSGGHALLVGQPGLGKTMLVDTLSTVLGLDSQRIQFTPDLMPADILGSEVLDVLTDGSRAFRFIEGPVFTQLLMADEINRASPRTQSALLQAMQEREVTVSGRHRPLGRPFHVLATQNPIEQEGTYPLPEAQLDRFLLQIDVDYPDRDTERGILLATTGIAEGAAHAAFDAQGLIAAQRLIRQMPVGEAVVEAILDLVRAFRPGADEAAPFVADTLVWGPGPRAAQALMLVTRARAVLNGRFAPTLEDVEAMAPPVLRHRMALSFAARARGETTDAVIARLLDQRFGSRQAA